MADQLCIGLADPEIQEDLLKDPNQSMSVEETIRFVEVRAAGKRSAVTITTPTSTNVIDDETDQGEAINSGYRKQQRFPTPRTPAKATTPNRNQPTHNKGQANTPKQPTNAKATNADAKVTCSFCGQQGHGERARTAIRRLQCPAFGSTCSACSKPNHYASLCWQNSERESAIRESVADMSEGTLPHQTWDSSTGSWIKRRSPPQPNLDGLVSTHQEDYKTHGHTLRREKRNLATTALADTGCQSCLAGPALQKELGLETQDLIPASLSMSSASGHPLPILGAALIRLELKNSGRSTRQMIYFSTKATKLYLSLATCMDLGLIGSQFSLGIPPPPDQTQPIHQVHDCPNHHLHPHQETASLPPRALTPLQRREEQPPNQAGHARAHREHHHPRCQHRYHSLGWRRTVTGLSVTCWTTMQQVRSMSVAESCTLW